MHKNPDPTHYERKESEGEGPRFRMGADPKRGGERGCWVISGSVVVFLQRPSREVFFGRVASVLVGRGGLFGAREYFWFGFSWHFDIEDVCSTCLLTLSKQELWLVNLVKVWPVVYM